MRLVALVGMVCVLLPVCRTSTDNSVPYTCNHIRRSTDTNLDGNIGCL